jgi:hypothetical protein
MSAPVVAGCWLVASLVAVTALDGQTPRPGPGVQVEMRHVDFHVDSTIVLHITYLRGALDPTGGSPPSFDDKQSFAFGIDSAVIAISPAALGDLLNRYVFAYPGSPLRHLTLSVEHGQLKQEGRLRGVSFTAVGALTVTPAGELRLHPISLKSAGIPIGGLMKFFGLNLEKLAHLRGGASGVRIEENDFLLSPAELLPPPKVRGRLTRVEVRDTALVTVLRSEGGKVEPLHPPDSNAPNYMYYRGGVLRFGKLTMTDGDLELVDADPRDPFDFFLDQYRLQLMAGYARTTRDDGLIVHMPDYRQVAGVREKSALPVR